MPANLDPLGGTRRVRGLLGIAGRLSGTVSPTLCHAIDGSPPGPAVPGILQARTLESKFAGILSAALSQHHLSGFEIAQVEFHHLH